MIFLFGRQMDVHFFFAHQKLSDRRQLQDLLGNGIKKKAVVQFRVLRAGIQMDLTRSDAKQMAVRMLCLPPSGGSGGHIQKHKLVKGWQWGWISF